MLFASNGCTIEIGSTITLAGVDLTEASFSGQTWTNIAQVENLGSFGDTASEITFDSLSGNRTLRLKGTRNAGSLDLVCGIDAVDAGQIAAVAAERTVYDYAFRVTFTDPPPVKTSAVTITIAAPGVVSWNAHGLVAGTPVVFTTTGALPTGLTAGTTYYVSATGLTTNSFSVSATSGGAAITTSGTQSGVHTATTAPVASRRLFAAKVASVEETIDAANNVAKNKISLWINSNVVRVAPIG